MASCAQLIAALLALTTTNVVAAPATAPSAIIAKLEAGVPQAVLVEFDAGAVRQAAQAQRGPHDRYDTPAIVAYKAQRYAQIKSGVQAGLPKPKFTVLRDYSHLPLAHVRIADVATLNALLARRDVLAVHEDRSHRASLAQSAPLIGQPTVAAAGFNGAGTTVVVADTGANYTLPAFGSCTAPGTPASCKVSVAQDLAPNDGTLDDASNHGTNVAAIVAGIAPGTKLAVFDVFGPSGSALSSHIIGAIDWAIANQSVHNVAALNLSIGDGVKYTAECAGANPFATPIADARDAGILSAVASGNEKYIDGISSPACTPGAVSVGAVYDANYGQIAYTNLCTDATTAADKVTCFSNSAGFLKLLAPGALIAAAGYSMAGTSQAAPHAAAAIAVLRARYPGESPDATFARLVDSGAPVTDARNGLITPRLSLLEAARPVGNRFADAIALTGATGSVQADTTLADKQSGEPAHAGNAGGASLWWTWVASADGVVTLTTQGSNFNTLLAVYTGTALNALTPVASNDDDGTIGGASSVMFPVTAGTTYLIAVDGFNGAHGALQLGWSWQAAAPDDGEIPLLPPWAFALLAGLIGAIGARTRRLSRY